MEALLRHLVCNALGQHLGTHSGSKHGDAQSSSERACRGTRSSRTGVRAVLMCWISAAAIFWGGRSVRLKAKVMENVAHLSRQEPQGPECCCLAMFSKEFWGWHGFWWVLGSFRGRAGCLLLVQGRITPDGTPLITSSR